MSWTSRAIIDCSAFKHNLGVVKLFAPNSKILAVIKANAYGHGVTNVITALSQADGYAVANINEAITVRGINKNALIVVLQGFRNSDDIDLLQQYQLHTVIHHDYQISLLESKSTSVNLSCWFKVDTGMGRLGFSSEHTLSALQRLQQCLANDSELVLMTHLANADEVNSSMTTQQINIFNNIASQFKLPQSIANSAGILAWQDSHRDWVRPGIMLYGASPVCDTSNSKISESLKQLKPAMTLQSRIISVQQHRHGDRIGYGGTWTCPEDMTVAVVGIGYGDGYPRHINNDTPVLLNGKLCPIIGRVSMDMLCVDVRNQSLPKIGDIVTLWGEGLAVEIIAHHTNTIAYELLCQLGQRVTFEYIQ